MGIKGRFKNAELHGVEINKATARIASSFAYVKVANLEADVIEYPLQYFDYIIVPDIVEHLYEPWNVLKDLCGFLKDNGKIVASIPNFMHYSVLREVLYGRGIYRDSGVVNHSHLRMFTLREINIMFRDAGYINIRSQGDSGNINDQDQMFINELSQLTSPSLQEQYKAQKYLIEANSPNFNIYLNDIIKRLSEDTEDEHDLIKLLDSVSDANATSEQIIANIDSLPCNRLEYTNQLAIFFYNNGLFNVVLPLLEYAIQLDGNNENTLYNLGYILFKANEYELSLDYLERIQNKDEDIYQLIGEARKGSASSRFVESD
ncbi:hypothetical protein D3C76_1073940 [compost metagenome]